MIEFLENVFEQINPLTAYTVLFISAYIENVVPPIPGDTVVLIGAYLVSTGRLNFPGVYISTTLGSVTGFISMYLVGKYYGSALLTTKFGRRLFREKNLDRVRIWFEKWGYKVIFINRFLSGTRSVVSLFAGMFQLRLSAVIVLSLCSSMIWNALLMTGGVMLGQNWPLLEKWIGGYNRVLLVLLVMVVLYFVLKKYFLKRQSDKET
jgi:membrane protein DedA with SNARE-associated domain